MRWVWLKIAQQGRSIAKPLLAALLVLATGVLLGRSSSYSIYRVETVMVISATDARGCAGAIGMGEVILGWSGGNSDGAYRIPCWERMRLGPDVQVVCGCSQK